MDVLTLNIVPNGKVCELKHGEEPSGMVDDCEKLLYLALAEAKHQPTQIQIHGQSGNVTQKIFVPESLYEQELEKRDALVHLVGDYLAKGIGLPEEVCCVFQDYNTIDELFDHLLLLLEGKNWGTPEEQHEMKYDRGDEIKKRENVIYLTADFLQAYALATPALLADFYGFPEHVEIDTLIDSINFMIDQKSDDVTIIYVVDDPNIREELGGDLLPVFAEEDGYLKIVAWVPHEVVPQNLLPVFDVEEHLIGWLDKNMQYPKSN